MSKKIKSIEELFTDLKEYNEFMGKPKFVSGEFRIWCPDKEQPPKESEYLTIGQAIDYMLESEDNVIEYTDLYNDNKRFKGRIKEGTLETLGCKEWSDDIYSLSGLISNWKNIKKHIEPKQKTLKEKIENKEPFKYELCWYKFNKNGVLTSGKGKPVSFDKIKEMLEV
jgi:hypothetical protein